MFAQILKDLSMSAVANGAIMIDRDGEIVASWATAPLEMDLIGAHHGIILSIVKDISSRHGLSTVRHVAITTDKARLVISTLKEGYCIVMALVRERPVGMALHELEEAVERIEREMG
ncbi:MAG TPA: roadblock/LC7 domain-containing protein [Thermodesulfobacteriota bacterium]